MTSERCDEVLELVGLAQVGRKRVGTYSLGMKQRLGLAAAMLGDPQVLLLDEPANGLDPEGIQWVRGFLRYLADEGRAVLAEALQRRGGQVTEVDGMLQVVGLQPLEVGTVALEVGVARTELRTLTPELEDVFLDLTAFLVAGLLSVAGVLGTGGLQSSTGLTIGPRAGTALWHGFGGLVLTALLGVAIGALIRSRVVALTVMLLLRTRDV